MLSCFSRGQQPWLCNLLPLSSLWGTCLTEGTCIGGMFSVRTGLQPLSLFYLISSECNVYCMDNTKENNISSNDKMQKFTGWGESFNSNEEAVS